MTYEKKRQIKIDIISVIQEWEDDEGEQLNGQQEADLATRIFNKLWKELK